MKPSAAARVLARVLDEVDKGRIALYRNPADRPFARCPIVEGTTWPSHRDLNVCVFDKDFHAWLMAFAWLEETAMLRRSAVDRIVHTLAGFSFQTQANTMVDRDLLQCIESEPAVYAVLEFMQPPAAARHEAMMGSFYKDLMLFATDRGLLIRGKKRFPGGHQVLSRIINANIVILEKLGIRTTIHRSNGAHICLERLDDSVAQSSAESSRPKSIEIPSLATENGHRTIINSLNAICPYKDLKKGENHE
jgi:hypothetical protein